LPGLFGTALVTLLIAGSARAALCVWRAPDEDIAEMLKAGSYKTVFEDITDAQRERIEEQLGTALDPDETQFKFFPVFAGDSQIGTVMTHAGKGQYGVIEVVVAVEKVDDTVRVKAVKIQRDREIAKAALRSAEFLGQFTGMTSAGTFVVGEDISSAADGAEVASQAVATAVRKLLIVYDDFYGSPEDSGER
jgi:hypothetical protein